MREETGRAVKGDKGLCAYQIWSVTLQSSIVLCYLTVWTLQFKAGNYHRT